MLKQKVLGNRNSGGRSGSLRKSRDFRLHSSDYNELVLTYFSTLDSPVALSCAILFAHGENDQLVQKEVRPVDYIDEASFFADFAAISFLRKNSSLKTTIDTKEMALQSFRNCENVCKAANTRLRPDSHEQPSLCDHTVLSIARGKISRILGAFDVDDMLDSCSFGPGSSLSIKGDAANLPNKFDVERDITRDAYDLFGAVMTEAYPSWDAFKQPLFQIGNKVVTVPKNAKTDRTIAIEPGLNTWIQLGIGRQIRKRLRSAGFNLDSDLKNQRQAYLGSIGHEVATVDFKAASDTIAIETVRLLLPPRWFLVLDAARSHYYTLDGVTHRAEKFSTMGNGFTFELESLIFVSLALALCEFHGCDDSCVSVFGDDLILPSECVSDLTSVCSYLGFTINSEKSFISGPFRESCGTYYFAGSDVKPMFLKQRPDRLCDVIRLCNAVRELSHRRGFNLFCDASFKALWSLCVSLVPKDLRLFGPRSAGDAVISSNIEDCTSVKLLKDGHEGFSFLGRPTVAIESESDSRGLLLARLHRPSRDMAYHNHVAIRARTRTVEKRMRTHLWYNYGSW